VKVWVDARKWDKKIITTAIESGIDAFLLKSDDVEKNKKIRTCYYCI